MIRNNIRKNGIDYKKSYLMDDKDFHNLDYDFILKRKIKLLTLLRGNSEALKIAKEYYSHNPIAFIEDWIDTYDPRDMRTVPFILFNRQKEYILWLVDRLENDEDGIVEKSRGVGVTHASVAFGVWMFLFKPEVAIGFLSRKLSSSDRIGDPGSLLEKGRMFLRRIPRIFLPNDFSIKKHCTYCKFVNPDNGSTIIAEGGDNVGRGGRLTMVFKDESAFYERPERIEAALSQTARCKIDISTVNGTANPFYRKRSSGKFPVFVFDWKDDPRYSLDWYNKEVDKLGSIIVARELDRDYFAGSEGSCISQRWIKEAIRNFSIDEINSLAGSYPIIAGLDVSEGIQGGDRNAFVVRRGAYTMAIHSWKEATLMETEIMAYELCKKYNVHILNYDGHGIGGGIKGRFEKLMSENGYSFEVNNVKVGESAPPSDYGAKFRNLKAYLWISVRERFRRLFEKVEQPVNNLIYIPNHDDLILELATPSCTFSDTGLLQIESKQSLKSRGVKSPDLADAFVLAYYFKGKKMSELSFV